MVFRMICLALGMMLFAPAAFAADTSCYRFEVADNPEMAATVSGSHIERWCYQSLPYPRGAYFVFNADEPKVRPEMSFVVEADGTMTHGSLANGELTFHKMKASEFNPFQVPLTPPHQVIATGNLATSILNDSAMHVMRRMTDEVQPTATLAISEGEFVAAVPVERQPFRGYWWPYHNAPLYGSSSSPLAKYDRFVRARTGTSPGARSWEASRHTYHGIWWEGHCNGWAASAILRAQPRTSKTDSQSGVTFSVSDQKGILAEKDYCANVAFFGRRYRGSGDISDIYPNVFHRVLTYYIGQLGKPVAMDYHRDPAVDNHVISGYKMTITKAAENKYTVVAVLTVHKYDGSRTNTPGIAPKYTRTYKYNLYTDSSGAVIRGSWISTNPDFLWVPLSPTTCSTNNPRVTESNVLAILGLPAAQ
jgi:hypothetical protein